jgi:hypothetical protein
VWFADPDSQHCSHADIPFFRSSQLIYQDNDHALLSVTLFTRALDEFKTKARESKFLVRYE